MMPLIRAEVRKLFTVRSTYILSAVGLLLIAFICFWAMGLKAEALYNTMFREAAMTAATIIGIFVALTLVLLVTHEYRFNMVMYTLTAANSRNKVLLAKLFVGSAYAVLFTLFTMAFAVGMLWLGLQLDGRSALPPQTFGWWDVVWRSVFFVWGYSMVAMFVSLLVRHVVGAVVVLLIVPTTVEGLVGSLLLKENAKYLPFSALEQVHTAAPFSPVKAALIFMAYLATGWLIAWLLFLKRDAN